MPQEAQDEFSLCQLHSQYAHFLASDPAVFDAPFFSIPAKEAAAMDPLQRLGLETAFRAFGNAGAPIEKLRGSHKAVFATSIVHVDTACSSSMVAVDLACQCIASGRASAVTTGEGVSVARAVDDGDTIRSVTRATGTNQGGRTPGLTEPSVSTQESLMKEVYDRAGISLEPTRYVEAHGTGTLKGDPIEVESNGRFFGGCRSHRDPLYV
ncbi:polyketide synthase [Xylariaceae sp. FL0804]|nr:polyketide synthase [Xylariaceae sp. FL0804]